jgi:hypothetical protein
MKKFISAFLFSFLMMSTQASYAKDSVHQIKIVDYKIKAAICKEMGRFKANHVKEFFMKAQAVSSEAIHTFTQLDCHVEGRLRRGKEEFTFDIQPVGVGFLINTKTKQVEWFGCKTCDHLFPPK